MRVRSFKFFAALAAFVCVVPFAQGAIIINEVGYDDGGTDDREFVELYNNGLVTEAIGGWVVSGRDAGGANPAVTITAGTMLAPGAYYVVGHTGGLNVNQVAPAAFLENDDETVEVRTSAGGLLIDALSYEHNKGATAAVLPADVIAEVGQGYFGNHQSADFGAAPSTLATSSVGRFIDGRDTNNNGLDFGMRVSTPGTTNTPLGIVTTYSPPDVSAAAVGSTVANFGYSFVPPRVINPTVADAINPNAISAPPFPGNNGNRAIIAWDQSGGGNGVATAEAFGTGDKAFSIFAYLDTRNMPIQTNAGGTPFRGSEYTVYGIGAGDALANASNISGATGFGPRAAPALADTDAGYTGVFWLYEKVGESTAGQGNVVENLYLIDAGDGGDATTGQNVPLAWTVLATVDLTTYASDWYQLGISIDDAGVGVARFNDQFFDFTTNPDLVGSFQVGYRENMQAGADGTPEAQLRPATFIRVPEPANLAFFGLAAFAFLRRRK